MSPIAKLMLGIVVAGLIVLVVLAIVLAISLISSYIELPISTH